MPFNDFYIFNDVKSLPNKVRYFDKASDAIKLMKKIKTTKHLNNANNAPRTSKKALKTVADVYRAMKDAADI